MMARRYLLFDLDNTLYPEESGLLAHLDGRIEDFLMQRLHLRRDEARYLREVYRRHYGTTLRGLMENHGIKPAEYIDHVYRVDLALFLRPDPELEALLARLPWPKAIFSNSPQAQIRRVLAFLGLEKYFGAFFGIEFGDYLGKPHPEVYRRVMASLGARGEECIMIDDSPANLLSAHILGMTTVLLGREKFPWVDYRVSSLYDLDKVLGEKSIPA